MVDFKKAIAAFGAGAKSKLANRGATGEPEDQLRAPLEGLFADLTELCGFQREWVAAVGESSLSERKETGQVRRKETERKETGQVRFC